MKKIKNTTQNNINTKQTIHKTKKHYVKNYRLGLAALYLLGRAVKHRI